MNSDWNHPVVGICILVFFAALLLLSLCVSLSDGNDWFFPLSPPEPGPRRPGRAHHGAVAAPEAAGGPGPLPSGPAVQPGKGRFYFQM